MRIARDVLKYKFVYDTTLKRIKQNPFFFYNKIKNKKQNLKIPKITLRQHTIRKDNLLGTYCKVLLLLTENPTDDDRSQNGDNSAETQKISENKNEPISSGGNNAFGQSNTGMSHMENHTETTEGDHQ